MRKSIVADRPRRGKVYLVGAGPGDPRLITVRGLECLAESDVVVYDYLAPESLLSVCRGDALKIFVGKRREGNRLSQEAINQILADHAGQGKVVTRLKGGDPFIFGRGGEEAEALAVFGIPFEIVPGVTAAIAVPAYAGIPLTHRDWTSSLAFFAGHEDPQKEGSRIDWEKISTGIGTLVFYMGLRNLPQIVRQLMAHGRTAETPIALIQWGTLPVQKTVSGTLGNILQRAEQVPLEPPVTIVVGEVVRLREKLSWYEGLPLFGRRFLLTRSEDQTEAFSKLLLAQGGEPFPFPTISVIPPPSWADLDEAIEQIGRFDWLVVTSSNGVRYFLDRLFESGRDVRALAGLKICAIGPKTADALSAAGLRVDLLPKQYTAEGVLEAFSREALSGKRILLARAKVARELLPQELRRRGAEVSVATAYETIRPEANLRQVQQLLDQKAIDMVTFTSSSTVNNFAELLGESSLAKRLDAIAIAAIGPVTAREVEKRGLRCDVIAPVHTIAGLTDAIVAYFERLRDDTDRTNRPLAGKTHIDFNSNP